MPSTCSVSGNIQDLTGAGTAGFVQFQLVNYGDNIPRIVGTTIVSTNPQTIQAAANGSFSTNLWGNDNINPGGTFYLVTAMDQYQKAIATYQFNITGTTFNLNSATPIQTAPVVSQPTGDTTYLRLDAGNQSSIAQSDFEFPVLNKVVNANAFAGADINAKVNAALTFLGANGGTVYIPAGVYNSVTTTASITQYNQCITGTKFGTLINYTGTGDCFRVQIQNTGAGTPKTNYAGFIRDLQIIGTSSGVSGVHLGDSGGFSLEGLMIQGFTAASAAGVWMDNVLSFTERTGIIRCYLTNNNSNILFTNTNGAGSSVSFEYTWIIGCHLETGAAQTGINVSNLNTPNSANLSHSTLFFSANSNGAQASGGALIRCRGANGMQDNFYGITAESTAGTGTGIWIGSGSPLTGFGMTSLAGFSPTTFNDGGGIIRIQQEYLTDTENINSDAVSITWGGVSGNLIPLSYDTLPTGFTSEFGIVKAVAADGAGGIYLACFGTADSRSGFRIYNGTPTNGGDVIALTTDGKVTSTGGVVIQGAAPTAGASQVAYGAGGATNSAGAASLMANAHMGGDNGPVSLTATKFLVINDGGTNRFIPVFT